MMPNQTSMLRCESSAVAEVIRYRTRSKMFENESGQCIFSSESTVQDISSLHYTPDDSVSSCSWLTPRFKVGSASCSTTPCCSTYCRNTPNAEDCSREDFAASSSFFLSTVESSTSPAGSVGCDVYSSLSFVPTSEDSEHAVKILSVDRSECSQTSHEGITLRDPPLVSKPTVCTDHSNKCSEVDCRVSGSLSNELDSTVTEKPCTDQWYESMCWTQTYFLRQLPSFYWCIVMFWGNILRLWKKYTWGSFEKTHLCLPVNSVTGWF